PTYVFTIRLAVGAAGCLLAAVRNADAAKPEEIQPAIGGVHVGRRSRRSQRSRRDLGDRRDRGQKHPLLKVGATVSLPVVLELVGCQVQYPLAADTGDVPAYRGPPRVRGGEDAPFFHVVVELRPAHPQRRARLLGPLPRGLVGHLGVQVYIAAT